MSSVSRNLTCMIVLLSFFSKNLLPTNYFLPYNIQIIIRKGTSFAVLETANPYTLKLPYCALT